jgi:hypothetical protein
MAHWTPLAWLRGVRVALGDGRGAEEVGLGAELDVALADGLGRGVTGTGTRNVSVTATVGPAMMVGGNVKVSVGPEPGDTLGLAVGL